MVTHSLKAASRAGRILFIRDGQVYHQLYRGEMTNEQFYEKISDALTVMTRKDAMDGEMARRNRCFIPSWRGRASAKTRKHICHIC